MLLKHTSWLNAWKFNEVKQSLIYGGCVAQKLDKSQNPTTNKKTQEGLGILDSFVTD